MLSTNIIRQSIAKSKLNPPRTPYSIACSTNNSLPKRYNPKIKMPNLILHKFFAIDNLKNSTLFKMADKMEIERVNSFHHQALKQVAKGLKVVATAPDGIIEAVEAENEDGPFILGVQFHPEMMFDKSTFVRGMFKRFINICIESRPAEVILKDETHHTEENKEKNIDEKIKEIEDEEKKEFFKGDL